MYRKLTTVAAVAALTLGLAACGGGGDGDDTADAPTTMEPTGPTPDEQIATLQAEINALRAELGLDPVDIEDLTGSVSDLEGQVADLTQQIADRDKADADAEAEAKAKEMAAVGKALHAALAGNATAGTNALANIGAPTLAPAGLTIDAAAGAGALPDATDPDAVTLAAGDSAGSLGTWAGTMYSHTQGSGPSKITNEAVVYTNRGAHAGPSRPFAEVYDVITASGPTRGYTLLVTSGTFETGLSNTAVSADAFTHSGVQTHTAPSGMTAFTTRGTYDGAPGTYRCVGTDCTSTNDGKGSPSALGGTWHFKADAGAMTSPPDTTYLYYGWWVSKDSDGDPTAASAFAGEVGDVDGTGDTADGSTLTGSATYEGHAAGKFASTRTADGSNNGGHFTADAELTAKFGAIAALNSNGVTGTIDNFRLNDGTDDPGWSVKLNRSTAWGADGAITGGATVWSINGNAASASGGWSGTMYDESPGAAPGGDGSTVPTTVTGTFYSEHGSTHRMVGGFAAEKQ